MSDQLTPESDEAWKKFVSKGDASKLFRRMRMLEIERNKIRAQLAMAVAVRDELLKKNHRSPLNLT